MTKPATTVGIFGGSFNPIHSGHAILANYIIQYGGLDQVWFMVSAQNPLKAVSGYADDNHRLQMAQMVARRNRCFRASDLEMHMPRPSYTIDTLGTLREKYAECRFVLIIGADNWQIFDKWRDYRKIIDEYGVVIYPRMGYEIDERSLPANVRYLRDAPVVEISSTFIRQAIGRGDNMEFFMPDDVYGYIKEHHLYEQ